MRVSNSYHIFIVQQAQSGKCHEGTNHLLSIQHHVNIMGEEGVKGYLSQYQNS